MASKSTKHERDPGAGAPGDPTHDPGTDTARERAELAGLGADPVRVGGAEVRIGTAGWTDRTLTAPGVFYPPSATSAEARLRYYASRFPFVEVDGTYYALPSVETTERWAERTPAGFVFNLKAYALLTGHPAEPARLPADIRDALPAAARAKQRVYARDLPADLVDEVWRRFTAALGPLRAAGKLGVVLLQFPPWLRPSKQSAAEVLDAAGRLGGAPVAVEFRHREWFEGRVGARTLEWMTEHRLPLVLVDAPQGFEASIPPLESVTVPDIAVFRLHGRRVEAWARPGATVLQRYRYLYDAGQLGEIAGRVRAVAERARKVQVVFNNCYANYGTTNARELMALLGRGEPAPVPMAPRTR